MKPIANTASIRRRTFAEHLVAGKSAVDAARLAGFKGTSHSLEVTASRLLRNAEVQALVSQASEKASECRIITAKQRREKLSEVALGTTITETITEGPMGTTTTKRQPTCAERIGAIKHLDELDGLLKQKVEHSGEIRYVVALPERCKTVEEWTAKVARGLAAMDQAYAKDNATTPPVA